MGGVNCCTDEVGGVNHSMRALCLRELEYSLGIGNELNYDGWAQAAFTSLLNRWQVLACDIYIPEYGCMYTD